MGTSRHRFAVAVLVAVIATVGSLGLPPTARAACAAAGTFAFTAGAASGTLVLSPDGTASLEAWHPVICPACLIGPQIFAGRYQIVEGGDGRCLLSLELEQQGRPPTRSLTINGVIAFQGLAILFQASTEPGFGAGLALHADTLRSH